MAGEIAAGIAVVVAVAAVVVLVFHKIRQPVVVGYIIAGILLSIVAVPLIQLFQPPGTTVDVVALRDLINGIATLGIILLLFSIGLEFNLRRLRDTGLRLVLIGSVEMVIVFASGYLLGLAIGFTPIQAVFLGAAMSAASTTVLVKLLTLAGHRYTREGDLVVGILIVEDLIIVIFLTALVGYSQGVGPSFTDVAIVIVKIAIFFVASILLGMIAVPRLVDHVASLKVPEILLVVALGLGFGLALFSTALGLSEALGAFVMGLIVGEARSSERVKHLIQPVRDLFVAVFFVSIGMLIDPAALMVPMVVLVGIVVAAVFIIAKFSGVFASAVLVGTEMPVAIKAGLSMIAMGEFSLVVARVGAESGVFPAPLDSALMLMVIVGVLITSIVSSQSIRRMESIDSAIERRLPVRLKEYSLSFTEFNAVLGRTPGKPDEHMKAVYAESGRIGIDIAIIATIVAAGALAVVIAPQYYQYLGLPLAGLQLALIAAIVLLAAPPFRDIVRRLSKIIDLLSTEIEHRSAIGKRFGKRVVAGVMRSLLIAVTALVLTLSAVIVVTSLPGFSPLYLIILIPPLLLFGWFFWGAFEQVHHRFEASVASRAAPAGSQAQAPGPLETPKSFTATSGAHLPEAKLEPNDADRDMIPPAPLDVPETPPGAPIRKERPKT